MRMIRKPTFAGKVEEKDSEDIFYWAFQKTAFERLCESWRLNCINHGYQSHELRLDKTIAKATKRNG